MLSEKPRSGLSETRKITKSTMEKKRRARINNSLTELKSILSGMVTNKGERFDKMEKADILEMTVKCVRQLQRQANTGDGSRFTSIPTDEDYRSGMHTCMSEVIKFISSSSFSDTDPEVKTKLLDHLANKLHSGTTKKINTDSDKQSSYKEYIHDNTAGVTDIDSGSFPMSNMSNDSNNNLQTINDQNSPVSTHSQTSPTEPSPMASPVFASYKPIQPILDNVQQPQSVPTVPLTILVPANICSAAVGTTCVIPLNLPTASPQLGQNGVLAAVTQPSQTNFTINSGSGISLISASNFLQNTHVSSKANDTINLSPEGRVYTFTPTVVSDNHRPQGNIFKANDAVKPTDVPFPPVFHSQSDDEGCTPSTLKNTLDPIPSSMLNCQKVASVNEARSQHVPEFSGIVPRAKHANENCTHTFTKCCFKDTDTSILGRTVQGQFIRDRRTVEQEHSEGQGKVTINEQRQFMETNSNSSPPGSHCFMYNSKPPNVCDNSTAGMWRPW